MPKIKVAVAALLLVAAVPLLVASANSRASASSTSMTVAEAPGATPNYIFPFMSCAYDTTNNVNYLQRLIYQPLFWYGAGGSTAEVPSLSIANKPVFSKSRTSATFTVKPWRFADGQYITGRSVMFFLNLWVADPTGFCPYEPGLGIPGELRGASATGNTVHLFFTHPVNPAWIVSNFLSLITPLPEIWDRTSPRSMAHCSSGAPRVAATVASCRAVAGYLTSIGSATSTFTDSFWRSGVDGPWVLSALDSSGNATFSVNHAYSGTVHPQLASFTELAYRSAVQELRDLESGVLDVGNLDFGTLTGAAAQVNPGATVVQALSTTDTVSAAAPWSVAYIPFNFGAADLERSLIGQGYLRAAMQMDIDQAAIVKDVFGGYATAGAGPLPAGVPVVLGRSTGATYPYDPSGAAASLDSHGWRLSGGVLTCANPGAGPDQCGAGIAAGASMTLNLLMPNTSPLFVREIGVLVAGWKAIGIQVNVEFASYGQVTACSTIPSVQLCAWDAGWTYAPAALPTGESLFATTGSANVGAFSDAAIDALINQTVHAPVPLTRYANAVSTVLPALFIPQEEILGVTAKNLKSTVGLVPNPLGSFTPAFYHW